MRRVVRLGCLIVFIVLLYGIVYSGMRVYYPQKYARYVLKYSQECNLSPSLVYAVIHTESRFDSNAQSSKGAYGLMQITPDTLEWISLKHGESISDAETTLLDPQENIRFGCMLLSSHMEEFGDLSVALAAYNAGRGRVLGWLADWNYSKDGKHLDQIPFDETRDYINQVIQTQKIYQRLYFKEEIA